MSLKHGDWQSPHHKSTFGKYFRKPSTLSWTVSHALLQALASESQRRPGHDIFQFGVYVGSTLHSISRAVPEYHHLWGFDSFQGLPQEIDGIPLEGAHWQPGAFSAADSLKEHNLESLLARVHKVIDHKNVTLVPGYFNETLPSLDARQMRPALLVDMDCDLYISAMQSLRWLFRSGLMGERKSCIIEYSDPSSTATMGECCTEQVETIPGSQQST